jgi:hypothetical protein
LEKRTRQPFYLLLEFLVITRWLVMDRRKKATSRWILYENAENLFWTMRIRGIIFGSQGQAEHIQDGDGVYTVSLAEDF